MANGLINAPELYESSNIPEAKKDRLRVSGKEIVIGIDYDRIDVSYPTPTTESYVYKLGALIVSTIEVTYLTSAKKDVSSVVWS